MIIDDTEIDDFDALFGNITDEERTSIIKTGAIKICSKWQIKKDDESDDE